ncbi:MAG: alpha-amylase family glycosyl hydrolase [Wenzhouxiangella sp.]
MISRHSACSILVFILASGLPMLLVADERRIEDEVIYFVMPDRFYNADPANDTGGIDGGSLQHGFDPTHKGFYHGGDLKGLTKRLDYIQALGATAIWLTPVFRNKPVQGPPGDLSAGYHGYWITDFTDIDPHLGTKADFRALVTAAHARGMKVIMDIITNHTADVIQYKECAEYSPEVDVYWSTCNYRSIADYPYTTRGRPDGEPINEGFLGDAADHQTAENFARLTDMDYAWTPFIPEAESDIKAPAWLNDIRYYHNRGNSEWHGESSLYGDFAGLDDLYTENPRVVEGMIEIYKYWISEFRVDGFRVDTTKHVNDEFWLQFNPAILTHAEAEGINDFYLFGEAYELDPTVLARYTTEVAYPSVLDFPFRDAAQQVIAHGAPTRKLEQLFAHDHLYQGDERGALILPTFVGNHDDGRLGRELLKGYGLEADDWMLTQRQILGHALMIFARGVPVIYYGDEQGFTGDGGDKDARQNMFPSQVASYNDNRLIGTSATHADNNFDEKHPVYQAIAEMNAVYHAEPGLRRGAQRVVLAEAQAGLFAFTRSYANADYLVVLNTADDDRSAKVTVRDSSAHWQRLIGSGPERLEAVDQYLELSLPSLSWSVFKAHAPSTPL